MSNEMKDITIGELARWNAALLLEGDTIYVWARNPDSDEMLDRMQEAGFTQIDLTTVEAQIFTRSREVSAT